MPLFKKNSNLPKPPDLTKEGDYSVFVTKEEGADLLVPINPDKVERSGTGLFHTKVQDIEEVKEVVTESKPNSLHIRKKEIAKEMQPIDTLNKKTKSISDFFSLRFRSTTTNKNVASKRESKAVLEKSDESPQKINSYNLKSFAQIGIFILCLAFCANQVTGMFKIESQIASDKVELKKIEEQIKNTQQRTKDSISTNMLSFARHQSIDIESIFSRAVLFWKDGHKVAVIAGLGEQTYTLRKIATTHTLEAMQGTADTPSFSNMPQNCTKSVNNLKEDSSDETQTFVCKHSFRMLSGYGID